MTQLIRTRQKQIKDHIRGIAHRDFANRADKQARHGGNMATPLETKMRVAQDNLQAFVETCFKEGA